MSERVARSRELVARGFAAATVARVMQISRQALYRVAAAAADLKDGDDGDSAIIVRPR